jgi:hypothetical protein
MDTTRFVYSSHLTWREAQFTLEDYFASGEIDPTDDPKIERDRNQRNRPWVITLRD